MGSTMVKLKKMVSVGALSYCLSHTHAHFPTSSSHSHLIILVLVPLPFRAVDEHTRLQLHFLHDVFRDLCHARDLLAKQVVAFQLRTLNPPLHSPAFHTVKTNGNVLFAWYLYVQYVCISSRPLLLFEKDDLLRCVLVDVVVAGVVVFVVGRGKGPLPVSQ